MCSCCILSWSLNLSNTSLEVFSYFALASYCRFNTINLLYFPSFLFHLMLLSYVLIKHSRVEASLVLLACPFHQLRTRVESLQSLSLTLHWNLLSYGVHWWVFLSLKSRIDSVISGSLQTHSFLVFFIRLVSHSGLAHLQFHYCIFRSLLWGDLHFHLGE